MSGTDPADGQSPPADDPTAIGVTPAAKAALEALITEHGPLMFVESHGCCDNNAPMCFADGEFLVGSSDVKIADVEGCPYFVDARTLGFRTAGAVQLRMQLDIEPGYADGMSLGPPGSHFVIRPIMPTAPIAEVPFRDELRPEPR